MQIVILVESKSSADIDYQYIRSFIKKNYPSQDRHVKLNHINLNSKTRLEASQKQIEDKLTSYAFANPGEKQFVGCCLDTDTGKTSDPNRNKRCAAFCKKHGYELVWFHRDIEEVFIGKRVKDNQKVREAKNFVSQRKIESLNLQFFLNVDIESSNYRHTNLKAVFDEIMKNVG